MTEEEIKRTYEDECYIESELQKLAKRVKRKNIDVRIYSFCLIKYSLLQIANFAPNFKEVEMLLKMASDEAKEQILDRDNETFH
jgi:hypothetical protein